MGLLGTFLGGAAPAVNQAGVMLLDDELKSKQAEADRAFKERLSEMEIKARGAQSDKEIKARSADTDKEIAARQKLHDSPAPKTKRDIQREDRADAMAVVKNYADDAKMKLDAYMTTTKSIDATPEDKATAKKEYNDAAALYAKASNSFTKKFGKGWAEDVDTPPPVVRKYSATGELIGGPEGATGAPAGTPKPTGILGKPQYSKEVEGVRSNPYDRNKQEKWDSHRKMLQGQAKWADNPPGKTEQEKEKFRQLGIKAKKELEGMPEIYYNANGGY